MKMIRNNGITLVSLVVTIIVLIVLAGISINLILGDNGIITIAKKAKENTELAKIEEETELNELYEQLENGNGTSGELSYDALAKLTNFKRIIAEAITNEKVETSAEASAELMAQNIGKILQARTADATATADNILSGKTAYVNGNLITGTNNNSGKFKKLETITGSGTATSPKISKTVSTTSIPEYQNMTEDDFFVSLTKCYMGNSSSAVLINGTANLSKSYNATDGILTIVVSYTCNSSNAKAVSLNFTADIYY